MKCAGWVRLRILGGGAICQMPLPALAALSERPCPHKMPSPPSRFGRAGREGYLSFACAGAAGASPPPARCVSPRALCFAPSAFRRFDDASHYSCRRGHGSAGVGRFKQVADQHRPRVLLHRITGPAVHVFVIQWRICHGLTLLQCIRLSNGHVAIIQ